MKIKNIVESKVVILNAREDNMLYKFDEPGDILFVYNTTEEIGIEDSDILFAKEIYKDKRRTDSLIRVYLPHEVYSGVFKKRLIYEK